MGKNASASAPVAPLPFEASTDNCYICVGEAYAPALLVNPAAAVTTILAAARRRADTLQEILDSWACESGDVGTNARDLAMTLEPTASEIVVLLNAVSQKLQVQAETAQAEDGVDQKPRL